jgi:hypothetical protein
MKGSSTFKPKKKLPPPGMIATPHGFVSATPVTHQTFPSSSSSSSSSSSLSSSSSVAAVTSTLSMKPITNPHVMTPSVMKTTDDFSTQQQLLHHHPTPHHPTPHHPSLHHPVYPTTNQLSDNSKLFSYPASTMMISAAAEGRSNRLKPASSIFAFGFGGLFVTMIPTTAKKKNNNYYYYSGASDQKTGEYHHGLLRVYKLIDLMRHHHHLTILQSSYGSSNATELKEFLDLLTVFPTPLSSKTVLTTSSSSSSSSML